MIHAPLPQAVVAGSRQILSTNFEILREVCVAGNFGARHRTYSPNNGFSVPLTWSEAKRGGSKSGGASQTK